MVSKLDAGIFSKEEQIKYTSELNELFPELINWELEDIFSNVIVLKAKNYILKREDGKVIYKGSALKSSKTEPKLKQFLYDIINEILEERYDYISVYNRYRDEILNITDITPWCTKKTLSSTVMESTRANETKVMDAISESEYVEGDKFYVFYKEDDTLCLKENFKGEYNKKRLLKRLYDTVKIFSGIIDINQFPKYYNKKLLKELGVIDE
jgi:hypothetical protein